MATVYNFLRGGGADTSLRLVHEGSVLLTGGGDDPIVQRFPSEQHAREHVERVLTQRRRAGYRIEAGEAAVDLDLTIPPELAGMVAWDEPQQRLIVTFKANARALCEPLLAFAAARAPRTMRVVCDPGSPGPAFARALAATSLPSVRSFVFDTPFQTLTRQQGNSLGDLSDVLAGLPALELAFLSGELPLRPCVHTSLRALVLLGDPLLPTMLSALARSRLPALERLGLALHHDSGDDGDRAAARAILGLEAPILTAVHVEAITDITDFLTVLLEQPLSTGLSVLDLDGSVDDEHALLAVLGRHAESLSRLGTFALPLGDTLSSEADERARAMLPNLVDHEDLDDMFLPTTYEPW